MTAGSRSDFVSGDGGRAASNVQPLRVFSDEEALAWLRSQGELTLTPPELAQQFGWNRQKVHRRLASWEKDGSIRRRGNAILIGGNTTDTADQTAEIQQPADTKTVERTKTSALSVVVMDTLQTSGRTKRTAPIIAITLGGTAIVLAAVAVTVNARYAASFGQSRDAAMMLAAIGVCIDILATVLPSAAGQLWHARHVVGAATAWGAWGIVVSMTLLAAAGWSASNIGDTVTARTLSADRASGLIERLHRLRSDRGAISEQRSVVAIEALIQAEQGRVDHDAWRATKGCSDVTILDSAKACAALLRARAARGEASRRDELDNAIDGAEKELGGLPAVSHGDPGAALVADVLPLSVHQVERLRLIGLTLMPSLAGLLMGLAVPLWRRKAA